jgi:allantoin racemase
MKILIINPNTTASFTKAVQEAVDKYKNVGTEVLAVNPTTGPETIESIFEEMLSGTPTLEVFLSHEADFDGFIIACYGNEGLVQAAREATSKPVIGITEASYHMACLLGRKFSVVTTGDRWESLLWDSVRLHGLESRCASMRPTSIPTSELEASGDEVVRQHLLKEARKAIEEDGADVILLGCAGMTGFDKVLEAELGVPVIDGVVAALKLMEGLIGYGVKTSKRNAYLPLDPVDLRNLPPIFKKAYGNH